MASRPTNLPLAARTATAAQLLDCSRAHVYQLMQRGHLCRIEIPGSESVRIPIEDVYALLGMGLPTEVGSA
jgi:excisionase family DNA binding protein